MPSTVADLRKKMRGTVAVLRGKTAWCCGRLAEEKVPSTVAVLRKRDAWYCSRLAEENVRSAVAVLRSGGSLVL